MTEPQITPPSATSSRKLLIGSGVAVAVAGAALVAFVLPAEYGIDPTGIGTALGVTKLSEPAESDEVRRGKLRTNVLLPLDAATEPTEATLTATLADKSIPLPAGVTLVGDRYTIELPPFESIEMKYELAQGAPMIFRWSATDTVNVDMHSHPYDGGTELTETFALTDTPGQSGVYVAPFTGIHGWYWQNRTLDPVTVTVDALGAMTKSMTFDKAGEHPRAMTPAAAPREPAAPAPEVAAPSEAPTG